MVSFHRLGDRRGILPDFDETRIKRLRPILTPAMEFALFDGRKPLSRAFGTFDKKPFFRHMLFEFERDGRMWFDRRA